MSLASIKQKESKGKKNVLPKLRTILANPYKQHSPVLPQPELLEFCGILKAAMGQRNCTQKTFAAHTHIQLGLESSLRAINGRRFSCVFVSLSLRPAHIIRLIASSAAAKAPTAPLYAQPKLEEVTYELFGVRALTLVLPLDLDAISPELASWLRERKKTVAPAKKVPALPAKRAKPAKVKAEQPKETAIAPAAVQTKPAEQKAWSGDYISCSDGGVLQLDQVDVQTETQQLGAALSNLVMQAQSTVGSGQENTKTKQTIEPVSIADKHMEVETDEDDFLAVDLSDYRPLTVHQIRPNPGKKPKKKRNKNKQNTGK
ncbi:hypothetical protein KR222_002767 [Zaprionus bogoriensis]|nr:hypothetical protein KR222_002767 [Zaprionus bogoriensis]